jgi:glucoamylase
MPEFTHERYVKRKAISPYENWRFDHQRKSMSNKKALRIEVMADAIIHWTDDNWQTSNDLQTIHSGLGIFVGDIFQKNKSVEEIIFTFFWKDAKRWENKNFRVKINS